MTVINKYPAFPRFINELVLIPHDGCLLIDGVSGRRIISGNAATRLLPRMVALMDGKRSLQELCEAVSGVPPEQVMRALSVLMSWGLVEDASSVEKDALQSLNQHTLEFFKRLSASANISKSGLSSYLLLNEATVLILDSGDRRLAAQLQTLLRNSGLLDVHVKAPNEISRWAKVPPHSDKRVLFILMSLDDDYASQTDIDKYCRNHGAEWLRVAAGVSGQLEIGPVFGRGRACYSCFREVNGPGSPLTINNVGVDTASIGLSVVAVEVLYYVSGVCPSYLSKGRRSYRITDWYAEDCQYFCLPDCVTCFMDARSNYNEGITTPCLETAYVFEEYIGRGGQGAVGNLFSDRRVVRFTADMNLQLKYLPLCEQLPLPINIPNIDVDPGEVFTVPLNQTRPHMSTEEVACLLRMTAGIKELLPEGIRRWAPNAGNLGSVELYLTVKESTGISPGLYFYEPQENAIAALKWRSKELMVDDLLKRIMWPTWSPQPELCVIFTGAIHRLSPKYGFFGHRLAYLDAGVAISQLITIARGLNIHARVAYQIADNVVEQECRLNLGNELVTAIVGLSAVPFSPVATPYETFQEYDRENRSPSDFRNATLPSIYQMLIKESRLENTEMPRKERHYDCKDMQVIDAELNLPKQDSASIGSLGHILAHRRSSRTFASKPVLLGQISRILSCASAEPVTRTAREFNIKTTIRILARQVAGLESGVYEYDSDRHALHTLRGAVSSTEAKSLFADPECGEAPLQMFVIANLEEACGRFGGWGYRNLLLIAGMHAHRLSIIAEGVGLVGSIVAGIDRATARTILGINGYSQFGSVAVIAGHKN